MFKNVHMQTHWYVALKLLVSVAVFSFFVLVWELCVHHVFRPVCGSRQVGVLVGILGCRGRPPPGSYKAPRQ